MRILSKARLSFASVLGGVAVAGLASPASAKEPAAAAPASQSESGTGGLEEIVVTAIRRSQALQDVPMTVDVATGEQLQKLNLFDFKDVQQLAPGLDITNNDGRTNSATLRGVAFNPDQGTSPAVDVYINEVPVDAQTAFTAVYDVAQMEVLRGTQGVFRGRTAPAGAITLTTRRPNLSDVEGYAQATDSDRDGGNFQGAISLPLLKDKVAVRFAALYDRNELNNVRDVNRNDNSFSRTKSGRISLAASPVSDLNVLLTYQYLDAKNIQYPQVFGPGNQPSLFDPARSGPPATVDDRIALAEGPEQFQNLSRLLTVSADWQLGNYTLSFNGGRQNSLLRYARDQDPGNAIPGYQTVQLGKIPYFVTTGELRLATNNNPFWNYSAGVIYLRQTGVTTIAQPSDQFLANPAPPTPFPASFGLFIPINVGVAVPVDSRTISPGFTSSFQLTQALKFEVGLRYNLYKIKQQSYLSLSSPGNPALFIPPFTQPTFGTVQPPNDQRDDHSITGGANLTYKVSNDISTYLAYGHSYRSGSAQVGLSVQLDQSLVVTRPEKSNAVELGVKTNLTRNISLNADVFYQKFDGYISRNTDGVNYSSKRDGVIDGGFVFNFNADATVKGAEVTLSSQVTPDWKVQGNLSYAHARYDNALVPCNDFNGTGVPNTIGLPRVPVGQQVSYCRINDRLGEVPDVSLSLNSEYHFQLGALEPFVRGLFTYRPSFYSSQVNYDYSSRTILNLFGGLRGPLGSGQWEVSAFAKNVFDQHRITHISLGNNITPTINGAPFDAGNRGVVTTLPREIGVTLSYTFY
jgi:iron complex outermembrane receptor protein